MWRFGRAGERRPTSRHAPWDRRGWRGWTVPGAGVSRRGESNGASRNACRQPPLDELIEERRRRLTGAEPLEDTVGPLAQHREPRTGEDRLDRLAMSVRQPAQQQHFDLVAHEFGHDLVGAGIVQAADAGEVHDGDGAWREIPLDVFANRAPGGPRDEVGVETGDRLLQNRMHHDMWNHRCDDPPAFSATCSGMINRTCDPGNAGNPSLSGTSSSQRGTIAIRAVPLRMATLPSQRAR